MSAVADKIGVNKASVTLWEQGKTSPTHNNVGKFCKSIGITKQQFWGDLPVDSKPQSGARPC